MDVSRSSRAHCPYAFCLHALRACSPRLNSDRHAPGSGHFVSGCPARARVPEQPSTQFPGFGSRTGADTMHWVYRANACTAGSSHIPVAPTCTYNYFFVPDANTSQWSVAVECCSVGYWFCMCQCMCQCQCSGYRVRQCRTVQSRASQTQVAHGNFCFAGGGVGAGEVAVTVTATVTVTLSVPKVHATHLLPSPTPSLMYF